MARESARQLYGSTNKSSCVPGAGKKLSRNRSRKDLRGLQGQYLADALMVWDCYERAPRTDCPILLRFENGDYVASSYEQELVIEPQAGDICSTAPRPALAADAARLDDADCAAQDDCLVWLPAREFSAALGQQVVNVFVDSQEATVIVLEDCYLRLKPQGSSVDVFLSRY